MAQTKPFQWYQFEQPVAIPGMKADATNDVLDSFCAEVALNPGDVVIRGTDPETQIKPAAQASDASNAIGVAVHTQKDYDGEGAYYKVGDSVPVMTFGDVYVEAGASVTAGAQAGLVDGVGGTLSVTVASAASAVALGNMTFLTSGVKGDIVSLRVRK